jgi:UDP-glucose 4-epimerase
MTAPPLLLATGAQGLVMAHVLGCWLAANPEGRALALDLSPPDPVVAAFLAPLAARITLHQGDVGDPALWDYLDALPEAAAVTHVVHGAAVTSIQRLTRAGGEKPDMSGALPALQANIMGTARALAWAGKRPRLQRFITVSSGSVYAAEGPSPLPEDSAIALEGLYPMTKYTGELLTAQAARDFGLPALAVRLSGVYGPLDRETGSRAVTPLLGVLLRRALAGEELRLAGLDTLGDYIHAGDVGAAVTALLACPAPSHQVYNIAYGEAVSLRHLTRLVEGLVPGSRWLEVPAEEAELALEAKPAGGRWGAYDISRIRTDTGWRPRALAEALADYRDWLRKEPY